MGLALAASAVLLLGGWTLMGGASVPRSGPAHSDHPDPFVERSIATSSGCTVNLASCTGGGQCTINLASCRGGECTVNLGECRSDGDCTVNLAECENGGSCIANAAACDGGECIVNLATCGRSGACTVNLAECREEACVLNVAECSMWQRTMPGGVGASERIG